MIRDPGRVVRDPGGAICSPGSAIGSACMSFRRRVCHSAGDRIGSRSAIGSDRIGSTSRIGSAIGSRAVDRGPRWGFLWEFFGISLRILWGRRAKKMAGCVKARA